MSREALVIGINTYTYRRLPHLNSPAADAEAIAALLEKYSDFRVTRLPVSLNERDAAQVNGTFKVTLAELEERVSELFNPPGPSVPDAALLFFSGHGLRKERGGVYEGFLALSDTNPDAGNWGLSLTWLRKLLELSPVRQQIIWLDCCYSGEVLNFHDADPGSAGKVRDRSFIAASREYEKAYEDAAGSRGLLSGALLHGLNPENRADGRVSNYSLTDVVIQKLRQSFQQPVFSNSGGEIILTRGAGSGKARPPVVSARCPYKGLHYFDLNDEDPHYFFGRQALTDTLLDKVRAGNFLAVLGASGSGKSSVVRAGLLYQLTQGKRLSGSDQWAIHIFRPGDDPLTNLSQTFVDPSLSNIDRAAQFTRARELIARGGAEGLRALIDAAAGPGKVVLFIDQFEEVFTLCQQEERRRRFFDVLLQTLAVSEKTLCLVIAMRADFFNKCAEDDYSGLAASIQDHLITVSPMSQDELRLAITEPAKKAGIEIEPQLVDQMIAEVHGAPRQSSTAAIHADRAVGASKR